MAVYTIEQLEIDIGAQGNRDCPRCGSATTFNAVVAYTTILAMGVFGLLKRVTQFGACSACGYEFPLTAAELRSPPKSHVPFLHRFGLLSLWGAALLTGLIFAVVNN